MTAPPRPDLGTAAQRAHDLDLYHAACNLRGDLLQRVRRMNVLHARHAWERRRTDPLGPHAIGYVYVIVEPNVPARHAYRPALATRLFPAGEDVDELPLLLYELNNVAQRYQADGGLDPRLQMSTRLDRMPDSATFGGVVVSSLDTSTGTWRDVLEDRNMREPNVPGEMWVQLIDGTRMSISRRGMNEFGSFTVLSTAPMHTGVAWRQVPELTGVDRHAAMAWQWLEQLTRTIYEGVTR